MTKAQHTRLEYLRKDLAVWEERRRRACWSLAADKLYNCTAMDQVLGEMVSEMKRLEALEERPASPRGKRRPRET